MPWDEWNPLSFLGFEGQPTNFWSYCPKKDTAVVGKHFHFQELPHWMSEISHLELTGCCWEWSSITQGQLSGCGSYLSFSLSSLQIRPHTCSHNPKKARLCCSVGSLLTTTQHAGRFATERYYSRASEHSHCDRWYIFAAVKLWLLGLLLVVVVWPW